VANHSHINDDKIFQSAAIAACRYCAVFDTIVEYMQTSMFPDRPWGPGNNPKTAVHEFLSGHPEFAIAADIHNKLLITVAPDRYLRRTNNSSPS
jgi:cephalosporin hydroxylase